MDKEFIINMVIAQIGEDKAKEVIDNILKLADKMDSNKIYIIKRLGDKGICLISTNSDECKINFPNGDKPTVIELETELRKIESEF